ncbi:MAG: lipopolysaccharide heptosyltransferase, partial [Pseudomonadota bacterium]
NITLFGPTDPGLIGGYGQNQIAVISEQKSMNTITTDTIMTKLKALIS